MVVWLCMMVVDVADQVVDKLSFWVGIFFSGEAEDVPLLMVNCMVTGGLNVRGYNIVYVVNN